MGDRLASFHTKRKTEQDYLLANVRVYFAFIQLQHYF